MIERGVFERGMIEVLRPGALTSVQDLGRAGFESSGVPRGGAFDPWAARAANRLVGNRDDAALLELTLDGPTLRFERDATIALVGDDFPMRCDDEPCALGEAHAIPAGATLEIGRARAGARAWLALGGGPNVPLVLGSRSTELAAGFGGHEGRSLRRSDVLSFFPSMKASLVSSSSSSSSSKLERSFPSGSEADGVETLRIVPGPDVSLSPGGAVALAEVVWRVSPRSDRRGVRLEGSTLELAPHAPLRSQPMLPGAIELTPSGEPIVLGIDAPVTGGYPWVAQLVEADVGRLAHQAPGARLRFELVSFADASAALAARLRELDAFLAEAHSLRGAT